MTAALPVTERRWAVAFGVLAVLHDAAHIATHAQLLRDGQVLAAGPAAQVPYGLGTHAATEAERAYVRRWDA